MTRGLPPLPAPTAEDVAEATAWIDNWFEWDRILPGFRRNYRASLIQHRAELIRNERLRNEHAFAKAEQEMAA